VTSKNPNSNVALPREVVGNYVQLQSEIMGENLRILATDPTMIRLNAGRVLSANQCARVNVQFMVLPE
jgi:hypothetical protein